MRHAVTFDSYDYVRKLRDVGVNEEQAAVQAAALLSLVEERLATKQDIDELNVRLATIDAGLKHDMKEMESGLKRDMKEMESGLKRDMKEMETGLKRDMKELELRMVIKMGAMILAGVGMVVTANRLWPLPNQQLFPSMAQERLLPTQAVPHPTITPTR